MTHASVFSGIGGPEIAAAMLGWDNLFHCEINPFGRAVLNYWFPNSVSYEDITKTDFSEWRGRVNVLTGGFPCQPFSYAGKRGGAEDDRYLWPYMFRCIDQVRPDWVVCENVAGILTMVEQGEVSEMANQRTLFDEGDGVRRYRLVETFTLQRICDDLEGHGYSVQPVLIPALAVGAPHRRDRVFIVGHRNTENSMHSRQLHGQDEKQGSERYIGAAGPGDSQRLCGKASGTTVTDTDSEGLERYGGPKLQSHQAGQATSKHVAIGSARFVTDAYRNRGDEVHEHMEPELTNGAEPFSYGRERNVTDTDSNGYSAQAEGQGLKGRRRPDNGKPGQRVEPSEWIERFCHVSRDNVAGGRRWDNFPSVSPVHRGNDGLPFNVDDLTISFSKWRTESLEAYGNAIVPQVMYEIFKAIESVTMTQQAATNL